MLTAIVFSVCGRWMYRVADAGVQLEEGELALALSTDTNAELLYLLRHRWPALTPDACGFVRGFQAGAEALAA